MMDWGKVTDIFLSREDVEAMVIRKLYQIRFSFTRFSSSHLHTEDPEDHQDTGHHERDEEVHLTVQEGTKICIHKCVHTCCEIKILTQRER